MSSSRGTVPPPERRLARTDQPAADHPRRDPGLAGLVTALLDVDGRAVLRALFRASDLAAHTPQPSEPPPRVHARVVSADGQRASVVERVLTLTPYGAEILTDDALRAGPGAKLEVRLVGRATPHAVLQVSTLFGRAEARGVTLEVRGSGPPRRSERTLPRRSTRAS